MLQAREIERSAKKVLETFKLGGIVFLITSIIPICFTIRFFIVAFPIDYSLNGYGEWDFGIKLGYVIAIWLICVIPLTFSSMIGKLLLFTEKKGRVYFMPLITLALAVALFFVGFTIIDWLS